MWGGGGGIELDKVQRGEEVECTHSIGAGSGGETVLHTVQGWETEYTHSTCRGQGGRMHTHLNMADIKGRDWQNVLSLWGGTG